MKDVTVTLPDGTRKTIPYGTRTRDLFSECLKPASPENPVAAALVNNELVSLSFKIEINSRIEPVFLADDYGTRIFRRSLSFLLAMAAWELFPDRHLVIGHSLGDGYYYYFNGMDGVPEGEIGKISEQMHEIVQRNLPVTRKVISYEEALLHFEEANLPATTLLLEYRNESKIPIYVCGNYTTLSYEPLLPDTSLLTPFELQNYSPGLLLRFPGSGSGGGIKNRLTPFVDNPVLFSIYQEYKSWGKILDINCAGKLNKLCAARSVKPFIQVAEALHDKKISEIADRIDRKRDSVRVILVAGPSSSGKTTFTNKLAIQLRVVGFNPVIIGLDDYFLGTAKTPLDDEGKPDLESLYALDIELLNTHLLQLFEGKEVIIPLFNFKNGERRSDGRPLRLEKRSILLMEGIHGLNPDLTPHIPEERKYRIYVSALTQLNLDDHNRIPTTDNRLIRRMVRDNQFRGNDALATLLMWPSVRRGEDRNIFPYQNHADSAFNSALDYELPVLKSFAEPLLRSVKPHHSVYNEAVRLLSFLKNFHPIPGDYVPNLSILREFIGNSGFSY